MGDITKQFSFCWFYCIYVRMILVLILSCFGYGLFYEPPSDVDVYAQVLDAVTG